MKLNCNRLLVYTLRLHFTTKVADMTSEYQFYVINSEVIDVGLCWIDSRRIYVWPYKIPFHYVIVKLVHTIIDWPSYWWSCTCMHNYKNAVVSRIRCCGAETNKATSSLFPNEMIAKLEGHKVTHNKRKWLTTLRWSELKKTSSWVTMGPATDKYQAPTHRLKIYVRAVTESEAWPTVVLLKRKP